MESLLGFSLDAWDYATFAAIMVIVFAALGFAVFVLGLPGRIAIARNHPEADAVNLMGWLGFVAVVPWISGADLGVQADRCDRHPQPARGRATRDRGDDRAAQRQARSVGAYGRLAVPRRLIAMFVAILVLIFASAIFWLIFLKFKWIRLTPGWGLIFAFFVIHLMLVFLIGLRFVTPSSASATMVQHTIQLVPRLTQPAVVTEVLVKDNDQVTKGQPLFRFDRHPYEDQVAQMAAQLAAAKQNLGVLKADVDIATQKSALTLAQLNYERYQKRAYDRLVKENSAAAEDVSSGRPVSACRKPHISKPMPSLNAPISTIAPRSTA